MAAATTAAVTDGHTRYTAVAGTRELREEIARYLSEKKGLPYTGDQVLVSSGGKQSLVQVTMGMCGPGDEVLVPAPHWVRRSAARQWSPGLTHTACRLQVSYTEQCTLAGATSVVLPTRPADDFLLQPDDLEAAITPKTRMIILCNPS